MASACSIPSFTSASVIPKRPTPKAPISFASISRKVTCGASSPSSSMTDFDLYDLLGIDSSSDQSQIKIAYRTLQKHCHPDIAGPTGHDMAIILNQAYSVLSDPASRSAYDKEQSKIVELRGYTGKPIYSVWFGSESEERAVFVDEVKCIGCLKCALFADKSFAIETVYGRARVVAQWADPAYKIQAAIDACPVDCISMVERSDLAALEFLMSKQPRGNVRVGASTTGGERVSNIFVDVKKFQTRFIDAMNTANTQSSKETDLQREARMSTIQAIRSMSNWLYWQSQKTAPESLDKLIQIPHTPTEPKIKKLREAAAAIKHGRKNTREKIPSKSIYHDEYWTPVAKALPASTKNSSLKATLETSHAKEPIHLNVEENYRTRENQRDPIIWKIPLTIGIVAAVIIQLQGREMAVDRLTEHFGGALALEIVNSYWLQVTLAGITWYIIGMATIQVIESVRKRL